MKLILCRRINRLSFYNFFLKNNSIYFYNKNNSRIWTICSFIRKKYIYVYIDVDRNCDEELKRSTIDFIINIAQTLIS